MRRLLLLLLLFLMMMLPSSASVAISVHVMMIQPKKRSFVQTFNVITTVASASATTTNANNALAQALHIGEVNVFPWLWVEIKSNQTQTKFAPKTTAYRFINCNKFQNGGKTIPCVKFEFNVYQCACGYVRVSFFQKDFIQIKLMGSNVQIHHIYTIYCSIHSRALALNFNYKLEENVKP